jgi:hypothetical protein
LSVWALASALLSLLIAKVLYFTALPSSLPNLSSDLNSLQDLAALKKICVLLVDGAAAQKEAGWLLVSWGLWFIATWSFIVGLTAVVLHRRLVSSTTTESSPPNESIVDLALSGKLELWKAFWGFYIVLPYVATLVILGPLALLNYLHVVEQTTVVELVVVPLAIAAVLVVFYASAVVAWRCSGNTSRVVWRYLARIAIVLYTGVPLAKAAFSLSYLWSHLLGLKG